MLAVILASGIVFLSSTPRGPHSEPQTKTKDKKQLKKAIVLLCYVLMNQRPSGTLCEKNINHTCTVQHKNLVIDVTFSSSLIVIQILKLWLIQTKIMIAQLSCFLSATYLSYLSNEQQEAPKLYYSKQHRSDMKADCQ